MAARATGSCRGRRCSPGRAGATFAHVEVVEQAGRRWLVLRTARPAGYDEWPHWFHGPDQNPVSADTAFDVPCRLGWLAKPLHTQRREGGRVVAGGRVFMAMGAAEWPAAPARRWRSS